MFIMKEMPNTLKSMLAKYWTVSEMITERLLTDRLAGYNLWISVSLYFYKQKYKGR